MQKKLVILLLVLFPILGKAQSQRLILAEEFTSSYCFPCAPSNMYFDSLIGVNSAKIICLKYQVFNQDIMHSQNPTDIDARATHYNFFAAPTALIDGDKQTLSSNMPDWTQSLIDNRYLVSSPFTLSVSHTLSNDIDSVFITCTITASQAYTSNGNLNLQIALAEDTIKFATAPGSNYEDEFLHVMRKMYPSASGTALPTSWINGQSQTFTIAAPIPSFVYSKSRIEIVAFVESGGNKRVQQAAYSAPIALSSDIAIIKISGVDVFNCSSNYSPIVSLKNNGTTNLTSAIINYSIDNGVTNTYNWVGSLLPGAYTNVTLPSVILNGGNHSITGSASAPNGLIDYDLANNSNKKSFFLYTSSSTQLPYQEGFSSTAFPPVDWYINNNDHFTWERGFNWGGGGFGASDDYLFLKFGYNYNGKEDAFYLKKIDLSAVPSAALVFDLAYGHNPHVVYNDKLEVLLSADCGSTWNTIYSKTGTALKTGTIVSGVPFPSPFNWRKESINLTSFVGNPNVVIKFIATSNFGYDLHIDNINIHNTVGIDEKTIENSISIYPNPTSNFSNIQFNLLESNLVSYKLLNAIGQAVIDEKAGVLNAGEQNISLDLSNLTNGLYYLNITIGNSSFSKKVSIVK